MQSKVVKGRTAGEPAAIYVSLLGVDNVQLVVGTALQLEGLKLRVASTADSKGAGTTELNKYAVRG